MAVGSLHPFILQNYEVHEWRHATAILASDFPNEFREIQEVLMNFRLYASQILTPGGRKSPISSSIDGALTQRGWQERMFNTQIAVDGVPYDSPTHSVDCFKNGVALEIEWNNKDPFYDRDLNNFRLLFDLHVVSVGVIITRCTELQAIFNQLGRGDSYGASTTHMQKLQPRVMGGGGGGCPLLIFGISPALYVDDVNASSQGVL